MSREAPAWLADLQARFGELIRTPLDRETGTLSAPIASYDARIVGDVSDAANATAAERLAVYNRQYWFRLFDVLQSAFPLTARLLGYWHFNEYAARFLRETPPRGWDIDHAPDGFEAFLETHLQDDRAPLVESARIDAAWRAVFRAPKTKAFRPSEADASRLLDARLVPSPAVRIVEEHFPLLELRRNIVDDPSEERVAIPPALPHARAWALVRNDEGILQIPLHAREAELLVLLRELPVREALARIEQACAIEERARLPAQIQVWLTRSVERDFWIGIF